MTFNTAIEQQRAALLQIVMTLFAQMGFAPGSAVLSVSGPAAACVERVLLSAESAAAWLLIAQARRVGLVAADGNLTPESLVPSSPLPEGSVSASQLCARLNALFDLLQDLPKHARRMIAVQKQRRAAPSVSKRIADMAGGSIWR